MNSGMTVSDDITNTFKTLIPPYGKKVYAFTIMLNKQSEMQLEKVIDNTKTYSDALELLPENESRLLVTNFEFKADDGRKISKILLIVWNPITAPSAQKLTYTTASFSLKAKLTQINKTVQASDKNILQIDELKLSVH